MSLTIFLYFFLIVETTLFDLVFPIIRDVGKQFREQSLTKVIASISLVLSLVFVDICVVKLWMGVRQPVQKCLWKFSQPLVVFWPDPSKHPAHISGENVEFGLMYVLLIYAIKL